LAIPTGVTITEEGELISSEELPFIDLATIKIATDDFSDSNKLGQGGFGTVYKVNNAVLSIFYSFKWATYILIRICL
jgi:hypothetical protein